MLNRICCWARGFFHFMAQHMIDKKSTSLPPCVSSFWAVWRSAEKVSTVCKNRKTLLVKERMQAIRCVVLDSSMQKFPCTTVRSIRLSKRSHGQNYDNMLFEIPTHWRALDLDLCQRYGRSYPWVPAQSLKGVVLGKHYHCHWWFIPRPRTYYLTLD